MIVEESLIKTIIFIAMASCGLVSLFGAAVLLISNLSEIELKREKVFHAIFFSGVFGLMFVVYIFFLLLIVGLIH